jgi:hypothetical protein
VVISSLRFSFGAETDIILFQSIEKKISFYSTFTRIEATKHFKYFLMDLGAVVIISSSFSKKSRRDILKIRC